MRPFEDQVGTLVDLQREGKVDGHGGCSAAAFGVDHRKYLAARTFLLNPALGGGQADKCLE